MEPSVRNSPALERPCHFPRSGARRIASLDSQLAPAIDALAAPRKLKPFKIMEALSYKMVGPQGHTLLDECIALSVEKKMDIS